MTERYQDTSAIDAELNAGTPWITCDAVAWLDVNLLPTDSVFEIGAGRSSLYFAARVEHTHTLETSPNWARQILERMAASPALMRGWQLDVIPVDWSPTWRQAQNGYWGSHTSVLTRAAARKLERRYLLLATSPKDASILHLDGGLRSHLYVLFDRLDRLRDYEIVIVDNTEFDFAAYWYETHPLDDFVRYDFVAGILDRPDEIVQKSKHITTIFVRKDRLALVKEADCQSKVTWTSTELEPYRIDESNEETMSRVLNWEAYVMQELADYGF